MGLYVPKVTRDGEWCRGHSKNMLRLKGREGSDWVRQSVTREGREFCNMSCHACEKIM